MGFEKTVLAITEDCAIEGAYFAYGTLWLPAEDNEPEALIKLQEVFPDTVINTTGEEYAVDFVAPGQGKKVDRWSFVTV